MVTYDKQIEAISYYEELALIICSDQVDILTYNEQFTIITCKKQLALFETVNIRYFFLSKIRCNGIKHSLL